MGRVGVCCDVYGPLNRLDCGLGWWAIILKINSSGPILFEYVIDKSPQTYTIRVVVT